jgi:hypothetical protein
MDAINAIFVRCQSAHEKSPSNATRKAVAISFKATRQTCRQTRQGHREGVVTITTILYHDDEYRRKDVNHHNACVTNANCNVLQTSTGVKGHTLDAMTATIITVSMADQG